MEKIKDAVNQLFDKISNPLIFSFICSWLIINWQITVALLWYDVEQIRLAGYKTVFDFIDNKLNIQEGFLHPLTIALIYTFPLPIIKNCIRAFNTWVAKWGNEWNLRILKGGQIPVDRYFKLREDYEKRTQILVEVIEKESQTINSVAGLNTEILELKASENALKTDLLNRTNTIAQMRNLKMLEGYWTCNFSDLDRRTNGTENIYIQGDKYYIINDFKTMSHVFNIKNFYFDEPNKKIFFIKERNSQEKYVEVKNNEPFVKYCPNDLILNKDNSLVGQENGTTHIEYIRKIREEVLHG